MKAILLLLCGGSLALTGCMNTYDLTRAVPALPQYEVNAQLLGNTWTIERLDGVSMSGKVIAADRDKNVIVEESTREARTVPTRNIATIRSSPGVEGPILGLLGGDLLVRLWALRSPPSGVYLRKPYHFCLSDAVPVYEELLFDSRGLS